MNYHFRDEELLSDTAFSEEEVPLETKRTEGLHWPAEQDKDTEKANLSSSPSQTLQARLGLKSSYGPRKSPLLLLSDLHSDNWAVRVEALRELELLGAQAPREPIVQALKDENRFVRAAAARALGGQGEQAPIAPLLQALQDPEWRVRTSAAQALGELGARAPIEPLVIALHDEDESVWQAAAGALGKIGGPELIDLLHALIRERAEEGSRKQAAT